MPFPATDWGDFTPTEYQVGAPATSLHFERWFRNVVAAFQGAANAPRLEFPALGTLVAGTTIRSRYDAGGSSSSGSQIIYSFGLLQPGVIRVSADHRHAGGPTSSVSMVFSRWRVNVLTNLVTYTIPSGTSWTSRTLDISVLPGDTIVVYAVSGAGGSISEVRNVRLSTDGGILWPGPTFTPLE